MYTEIQKTEQVTEVQLISYLDVMGLAKSLTPTEKTQYIEICKAYQLNPFKREIHVTKYGENFSIVVGYETYLKRAERSLQLDGWEVATSGETSADGKSGLIANITIYRKDRKYPFKHEVHLSEYVGTTKDGSVTKFWKKPITMLKKVVTAQGFRLCFPDEMGGMPYIPEEMESYVLDSSDSLRNKNTEITKRKDVSLEEENIVLRKIADCSSLEQLSEIWGGLTVNEKNNPNILHLKNEVKTHLSIV